MRLELFRSVVEQVAPMTELVCFHLMGDPLVHPKFREMVEICDDNQVKIFLVTNGVLVRPEKNTVFGDTVSSFGLGFGYWFDTNTVSASVGSHFCAHPPGQSYVVFDTEGSDRSYRKYSFRCMHPTLP